MNSFRLKVQKVEQTCLFELSWGEGRQVETQVRYSLTLTGAYQKWRQAYFGYYQTVDTAWFRGRIGKGGLLELSQKTEWHSQLVQAEAALLYEFQHWLRDADLHGIREKLAELSQSSTLHQQAQIQEIFLICSDPELEQLPWEAWEIGSEFGQTGALRLIRTSANIRTATGRHRRGRVRILAILGDETGLNFQVDRQAVVSLSSLAEIQFVGWQEALSPVQLITQIKNAIVDPQGWDILFFAGHSNETQLTGGELGIAPSVSITVSEITTELMKAKDLGLQVAIFNSCSGLSIAKALIDIGFGQVAIMREPIHNRVAQEFLIILLNQLATRQNIYDCLRSTCRSLQIDKRHAYPSAFLVPSLFCHPNATLFRMAPGWKQRLFQAIPSRLEAIALLGCAALSLIPPVAGVLLDQRMGVQAVYRDWTHQIPAIEHPPVALVQIDRESTQRDARLSKPNPINRSYLADILKRVSDQGAKVIGIDYYLDRIETLSETQALRQEVHRAVEKNQAWIVFGTTQDDEYNGRFTATNQDLASPNWSLQGNTTLSGLPFPNRAHLPYNFEDCRTICPFGYLLSAIQIADRNLDNLSPPQLASRLNLRTQLFDAIASQKTENSALAFLERSRILMIPAILFEHLGILSSQPIIDLSIPPDRVYQRIPAWKLLDDSMQISDPTHQVVLIAPGGYVEAGGVSKDQSDFQEALPAALAYWQDRPTHYPALYTYAETYAYTIHHLIYQRLVIPIPDILLIALAIIFGRWTVALLRERQRQSNWSRQQKNYAIGLFSGITGLYGLTSLQLYISAAVLLPIVLPSVVFWMYILPMFWRKSDA